MRSLLVFNRKIDSDLFWYPIPEGLISILNFFYTFFPPLWRTCAYQFYFLSIAPRESSYFLNSIRIINITKSARQTSREIKSKKDFDIFWQRRKNKLIFYNFFGSVIFVFLVSFFLSFLFFFKHGGREAEGFSSLILRVRREMYEMRIVDLCQDFPKSVHVHFCTHADIIFIWV